MPILMYHSVSDEPDEKGHPYYWTNTTPKVFAEHMALLKTEGYDAVTLKTGMERLRAGTAAETKTVVLTFDDGYRDFYTAAYPIMRNHGFTGTMFLPTAFIGNTPRSFKNRECLTWGEVREMHTESIEFGSHTVNHPELVKQTWPKIAAELTDSKNEIEQQLCTSVTSFAYPYAFPSSNCHFVQKFADLLKQSKYLFSVTTQIGRSLSSDDTIVLKRLPVNAADDSWLLSGKLDGTYDWLIIPQQFFKTFTRQQKPCSIESDKYGPFSNHY